MTSDNTGRGTSLRFPRPVHDLKEKRKMKKILISTEEREKNNQLSRTSRTLLPRKEISSPYMTGSGTKGPV